MIDQLLLQHCRMHMSYEVQFLNNLREEYAYMSIENCYAKGL